MGGFCDVAVGRRRVDTRMTVVAIARRPDRSPSPESALTREVDIVLRAACDLTAGATRRDLLDAFHDWTHWSVEGREAFAFWVQLRDTACDAYRRGELDATTLMHITC